MLGVLGWSMWVLFPLCGLLPGPETWQGQCVDTQSSTRLMHKAPGVFRLLLSMTAPPPPPPPPFSPQRSLVFQQVNASHNPPPPPLRLCDRAVVPSLMCVQPGRVPGGAEPRHRPGPVQPSAAGGQVVVRAVRDPGRCHPHGGQEHTLRECRAVARSLYLDTYVFCLIHRSLSISFTRAQDIPKFMMGFGRGKGWESWGKIGRGGHVSFHFTGFAGPQKL
jgi:hypothetical protein